MEVHDRTFQVGYGDGEGTAFAIDIDDRQYLVTAKHVVAGLKDGDEIEISHGGTWKRLQVMLTGHGDLDVSVLAPTQQLAHKEMILACGGVQFFVGEDLFFLGFPHGLTGAHLNSPFPTPLLKKATVSAIAGDKDDRTFYLDGHTNPGFSGGPVYKLEGRDRRPKVLMIVSSLTGEACDVVDEKGEATGLCVYQNTGIMTGIHVGHALDIISTNSNGFELN